MSRFGARDKLSREVSQGLNYLARSGQNVRVKCPNKDAILEDQHYLVTNTA
jgi:hypothetical protein